MLENAKIIVIGGAGLIGSHIVDQLLHEPVAQITVFDNFARGQKSNLASALKDTRVKIFEHGGDILQTDILNKAMQGHDYAFHLAALWLLHCHEYPQSAFDVNIRGTFNVLESCVQNKIKKLIYSSSASVYGDAIESPMKETHPFNNQTFYGATKIAGEAMLTAYHHRYNLNGIGLRYMNVYGPRQDYKGAYIAVIMKILDRLDQGLAPIIHGDGKQSYDFISVDDVARANLCALKSNINHGFYNVGTGIQTTLNELTQTILDLTNSKLKIEYEPQTQSFVTSRIGDPTKAKNEISFEAKVDLREGLAKLIEWRREHKKLFQ